MSHGEAKEFFNAADYFVDRNIRQGYGHKVAIYTEHRNYTYNDIQKMVNKTANAMRDLGVRIEDRVMTLMLDVPQFYWRKREKTRQTMQGEWINTGDKYYGDKEGYYWCAGRADDMLKAGGIWVSPVEVENCMGTHPAVLESAVVGSKDDQGLIKPKPFVVLREGFNPSNDLSEELKKWVQERMAKYKYPRWIEFVKELPKSTTGKILRFKLR